MLMQILKIMSVTERNRRENCSNLQMSAIIYRPKLLGKCIPQWKYWTKADITYITIISVKGAIMPFILIALDS